MGQSEVDSTGDSSDLDRVLIIDDDRFVRKVLHRSLEGLYDIRLCGSGAEGIEVAQEWQPNVILLDVEMPGQNGYEVCDQLKQVEVTRYIPVVFLSSHSSLRERMLGYEAGGDDYLVKPCSKELLSAKLKKLTGYSRQQEILQSNAESASKTAMEALSTSFELGKAVRYVESTYLARDIDVLGRGLMENVADLELSACVMFDTRAGKKFFSSDGKEDVAPLEKELMEMLHEEKRFVDFGCRTQINYPKVALLIKNMPLDDRSRYGRLKDILPFVLGATDSKVRVIDAEVALLKQNDTLNSSVSMMQSSLTAVTDSMASNKMEITYALQNLTAQIDMELPKMSLDEDQEKFIHNCIDDTREKLESCTDRSSVIEDTLTKLVDILQRLRDEQRSIIQQSFAHTSEEVVEENPSADIELF